MTSTTPRFYLDMDPSVTFPAEGYGPTWNGWATPYVTLSTLCSVFWSAFPGDAAVAVDSNGTAQVWRTDVEAGWIAAPVLDDTIGRRADGFYSLEGLTLLQVTPGSCEGCRQVQGHAWDCPLGGTR